MSTKSFHKIILYARQHRATSGVYETIQRLAVYWHKRPELAVFLESETARHLEQHYHDFKALNLPVLSLDELQEDEKNTVLVVIGGDGSLLSAARTAVQKNLPIIGINRGRLGFLASINPDEAEQKLDEVFRGIYDEEQRFLLHACIRNKNTIVYEGLALNDIVLTQGDEPCMIEFDVFDHKTLISHYRADGLIVATPTGSTAYALSGGGPILHPSIEVITLVPMFPHTLSSRPIVLGTQDTSHSLHIHLRSSNESSCRMVYDGQENQIIQPDSWMDIKKYPKKLRLLQPLSYNYYDTLRSKLGWEAPHF